MRKLTIVIFALLLIGCSGTPSEMLYKLQLQRHNLLNYY